MVVKCWPVIWLSTPSRVLPRIGVSRISPAQMLVLCQDLALGGCQLTLPKAVVSQFPGMEYFAVSRENHCIVLTPVRIIRADAVRRKLVNWVCPSRMWPMP